MHPFLGELALLATARRTAQCVAVASCDLSILMANDLVAAMRDFPDSAAKVGHKHLMEGMGAWVACGITQNVLPR